jgi:copper chaperone CopZ
MKYNCRLFLISFFALSTIIFYSCNENTPNRAYDIVTTFTVEGMTCESCSNSLAAKLVSDQRIVKADVDLLSKECRVYHQKDISIEDIKKVITDTGFSVSCEPTR